MKGGSIGPMSEGESKSKGVVTAHVIRPDDQGIFVYARRESFLSYGQLVNQREDDFVT